MTETFFKIPPGLEWNQANLEPAHPLNSMLFSLLAFGPRREPKLVGTGFIIRGAGDHAFALTAAHVLTGAGEVQKPSRHHPTTPKVFLPEGELVNLDRNALMAVHMNGTEVVVLTLEWALIAEKSEIAILKLSLPDEEEGRAYFTGNLELAESLPSQGDQVGVLSYNKMKVTHPKPEMDGINSFAMERQLVLRCGRTSAVYMEGHHLCRGPCFETTIPVSFGMSGGPVFEDGGPGEEMRVMGLTSYDTGGTTPMDDRSVPGQSIVSLLKPYMDLNADGRLLIRLDEAVMVRRSPNED